MHYLFRNKSANTTRVRGRECLGNQPLAENSTHKSHPKATQTDLCQKQLQKEIMLGKGNMEEIKSVQGDVNVYS